MLKLSFLFVLLSIGGALHAQDKELKSYLKMGSGLYGDMSYFFNSSDAKDSYTGLAPEKFVAGNTIWIEGGYTLPNNIILSANVMYTKVKREYTDVLYQGQKYINSHQNYSINFGYELNSEGNHKFTPSVGLLVNFYNNNQATYAIGEVGGEYYAMNLSIEDRKLQDIGLNINFDYNYQFKNNLLLGMRVNALYLISIGFESFYLTPIFGVKF